MDGPFWSFVLDLAPIRRKLRREVSLAREDIEQTARNVLDRDRERHQALLDKSEQDRRELQRSVSELQAHVVAVEAISRDLRNQVAAAQEAERCRREQEVNDARDTTSDLFCCQTPGCASLWLLSMRPDHSYTVRGPIGHGCATCTGNEPLLRLAAIKASVTEPDEIARVARPVAGAPALAVDLSMPASDRAARTDIGVKFVADLLQHGPDTAIADTLAHQASTFVRDDLDRTAPATGCTGLSAIADGLDQVPHVIRDGIAWCATEIIGVPELPAQVLGEVASRVATLHLAPLHALHPIAQGIRAVGTVSCVADDHLGQCQCARHLVSNVAQTAVAEQLRQTLDRVGEMPTDISRMPQIVAEAPSPYDRWDEIDDDRWHDIGGIGGI